MASDSFRFDLEGDGYSSDNLGNLIATLAVNVRNEEGYPTGHYEDIYKASQGENWVPGDLDNYSTKLEEIEQIKIGDAFELGGKDQKYGAYVLLYSGDLDEIPVDIVDAEWENGPLGRRMPRLPDLLSPHVENWIQEAEDMI